MAGIIGIFVLFYNSRNITGMTLFEVSRVMFSWSRIPNQICKIIHNVLILVNSAKYEDVMVLSCILRYCFSADGHYTGVFCHLIS